MKYYLPFLTFITGLAIGWFVKNHPVTIPVKSKIPALYLLNKNTDEAWLIWGVHKTKIAEKELNEQQKIELLKLLAIAND